MHMVFNEKGENWSGIRHGILADPDGVATALEKLDMVLRGFAEDGESTKESLVKKNSQQQAPQHAESPPSKAPIPPVKAAPKPATNPTASKAIKEEPDVILLD